jgi:hypothetical protein
VVVTRLVVLNPDPGTFEGTPHVLVQPGGFECTSNCSEQFAIGSTVTFTAVDDEDMEFKRWGQDCDGQTGEVAELVVSEGPLPLTCQATFECEGFPQCEEALP